ncbi:MAG: hypothetical protein LBU34_07095 [Planctomycetaceae bacterium]|jgi:hypothetical protein|nr:hypothetical protein [Planctomycetaceae bacterium]
MKSLEIDHVSVIIGGVALFMCGLVAQGWDQYVANNLQNQLLRKYYSEEEIINQSLYIAHTYKTTKISNGRELPSYEHDQYRIDLFKATIFSKVFLFCSFVVIVFIIQYQGQNYRKKRINMKKKIRNSNKN